VGDDLGERKHLEIAAGMVVVLVGVEHIAQRLVGNRPHLRQDVRVVAIEHVVDEDHPFVGHGDGHVAAFPRDHVEIAPHALDAQRSWRLLCLRRAHQDAKHQEKRQQQPGMDASHVDPRQRGCPGRTPRVLSRMMKVSDLSRHAGYCDRTPRKPFNSFRPGTSSLYRG
jgi:hypothetical protein